MSTPLLTRGPVAADPAASVRFALNSSRVLSKRYPQLALAVDVLAATLEGMTGRRATDPMHTDTGEALRAVRALLPRAADGDAPDLEQVLALLAHIDAERAVLAAACEVGP